MSLTAVALLLASAPVPAFAGGVDGGGGGTLPADPVDTGAIVEIIHNAKQELRLFAKYRAWAYSLTTGSAVEAKLFAGEVTLSDMIEKTDIELRLTAPCLDGNQVEVDGSIHASAPGAICISAFRIAPKLIEERARIETEALILHELSHLLGADEAEAVDFQKSSAYWLKGTHDDTAEKLVDESWLAVEAVHTKVRHLVWNFDSFTAAQIAEQMGQAHDALSAFDRKLLQMPFSVHDRKQKDFYEVQTARWLMAFWYGMGDAPDSASVIWKDEYQQVFLNDEIISFQRYLERRGTSISDQQNIYAAEQMSRIHNREELKAQLTLLADYFSEQENYLLALKYGDHLLAQQMPSAAPVANPWEAFLGDYEVVSTQCDGQSSSSLNKTGFSVHWGDSGQGQRILLKRIWANSSSDGIGLFDGAMDLFGKSVVSVAGDQDSATRVGETGTNWSQRWSRYSFTLSRTIDGFQMVEKLEDRDWSWLEDKKTGSACTFQLKKM